VTEQLHAAPLPSADGPLDPSPSASERARDLVAGVTWSAAYQLFEILASLAAMLILVRVIPPAEYGRATAAIGILALLNTFSAHAFVGHALQTPGEQRPDWTLYWSLAWYTQAGLFGLCHVVAAVCWLHPRYQAIAPLLHLAAFGLLLEAPNQIGATMLRRELALRRLKVVAAASVMVKLTAMIAMGLAGLGAWAIVLGGNVMAGVPFGVHLLFVRRWRPRTGWWRLTRRSEMRAPLRFGAQQMTGGLIASARSACEAVVLPGALGFAAIGLINRAQGLYSTTLGRAGSVIIDAVYPLLPRARGDAAQFAARATMFLQVLFLIAVPGGLFVGLEGRALSRVLYGHKWIAMDSLIWPGAIIGASTAVFAAAAAVLLAADRLRRCIWLDALGLLLLAPALMLAVVQRAAFTYAVALALCEIVAAVLALRAAAPFLARGWQRHVVYPSATAGGLALICGAATRALLADARSIVEFTVAGAAFAIVTAAVLIVVFPHALLQPLDALGRWPRLTAWLRTRTVRQRPPLAVAPTRSPSL
jgi:O-antigen/teichoic acid export membrane protein